MRDPVTETTGRPPSDVDAAAGAAAGVEVGLAGAVVPAGVSGRAGVVAIATACAATVPDSTSSPR